MTNARQKAKREWAASHVGAFYKNEHEIWEFQVVDWKGAKARKIGNRTYNEARRERAQIIAAFAEQYPH
jgi:hypothetical protein